MCLFTHSFNVIIKFIFMVWAKSKRSDNAENPSCRSKKVTLNSSKRTQPKTLHLNFRLKKVPSQQIFKNSLESLRGKQYIKRTEDLIF